MEAVSDSSVWWPTTFLLLSVGGIAKAAPFGQESRGTSDTWILFDVFLPIDAIHQFFFGPWTPILYHSNFCFLK